MNSFVLKLRRHRYTIQQRVTVPIHRMLGRKIVHLIHPAKTGGTSVKIALMLFGCKTKTHYFCLYGHGFRLKDVPLGDLAIITMRDDAEREKSVMAARKWKAWNYGPIRKWWIGMGKKEHKELINGYTTAVPPQRWYRLGKPDWGGGYVLHTETLTEDFDGMKMTFGIPAWVKCGHANKAPSTRPGAQDAF